MDVDLHGAVTVTTTGVSRAPLPIRTGRIGAAPSAGMRRIDLRDHAIFPGLINAHDHLHINAVPPLRTDVPFANSYAWIEAFKSHFERHDVAAALRVPKATRLRHGGLKNLLSGATCVAHHDPWHPALDDADFPVALLRDFGWSYTLGWPEYGPPARDSFLATPPDRPWLIHLAEGTDATAQAELAQLDRLGCLEQNSVLIHGVGLSETDIDRVITAGAAVVWCPCSNLTLLGQTLDPRRLRDAGRLALGTDSRLSGARDLLDELHAIVDRHPLVPRQLLGLATTDAAHILHLPSRGHLAPGAHADLVIVEDHGGDEMRNLIGIGRSRIRAVVRDGVPAIADPDFAEWFEIAGVETAPVLLDGKPKLLDKTLADPAVIALEPGFELATDRDKPVRDVALAAGCC